MDEDARAVRVSVGRDRLPRTLVAFAAIIVAIAIVKPWSIGSGGTPGAGQTAIASAAVPAASSPTAISPPVDPNQMSCMSSTGERVLTLIRWAGHEVRTWQVPDRAIGSDPLDPSLVPLRITSSNVVGIGVCAIRPDPRSSLDASAIATDVRQVTVRGGQPFMTDLGVPTSMTKPKRDPDLGVLYGPLGSAARLRGRLILGDPGSRILAPSVSPIGPTTSPTGMTGSEEPWNTWAIGSYALEFRFASEDSAVVYWLRFDIVAAAGEPD